MNAKLKQILLLIDKTNTLDLNMWFTINKICKEGKHLSDERFKELNIDQSQIQKNMICNNCKSISKHNLYRYETADEETSYVSNLCKMCVNKEYKFCPHCGRCTKKDIYHNHLQCHYYNSDSDND